MTSVSERTDVNQLWYTRCPVPTASGLAYNLGWLDEAFTPAGLSVGVLQDAPPEIARHHFDHQLVGLFREGGNVPALVARSEGAPTRLIGLTWIDEWQSILTRPDAGITSPADLRGRRVAIPGWAGSRATSFPRAMALHGFVNALALADLTLDDVDIVEVESRVERAPGNDPSAAAPWPGLTQLADGLVDAVYVKGARSAEQARELGAVVAIDLDATAERSSRVNNGTPRPITVHEDLLAERPEIVVQFLVETLRASRWAATHVDELRAILGREVGSGADGVIAAYGEDVHLSLTPTLDGERLALLDQQQRFLHDHGFLASRVDVASWAAHEPLAEAARQVAEQQDGASVR
ncbi:ABC transporter substrate-binding protein [Mumia zhuanghuii]|uniref:ABC transporter substrate-binding protein n=2 Tax=Mumia TaxID=1546255 RepID=A0ABW1QQK3_9ACTN|nr:MULTISPECIES: ABC transporter substrate-binding protein [Mumia]KAA1420717.1 ABC transporter substrate-binding protein [Mumia zhuanghuii]